MKQKAVGFHFVFMQSQKQKSESFNMYNIKLDTHFNHLGKRLIHFCCFSASERTDVAHCMLNTTRHTANPFKIFIWNRFPAVQ